MQVSCAEVHPPPLCALSQQISSSAQHRIGRIFARGITTRQDCSLAAGICDCNAHMHILTISSFVAGAAGFSFMAPPTGNHMVGASMKGAFACTNHAGFSGARCGPAITMAETKPEGERKLPLRSAFLGLIALQSIAALSTEIPGLLSENPAYFGTAVDAAFLAYATNILLQQAGVVRGASMPPETIASLNGFECGATLSIGRETGTWMPQEWAASGARLSLPLTLRFSDEEVDLGFPGGAHELSEPACRALAPCPATGLRSFRLTQRMTASRASLPAHACRAV